jgi:hypothetical protein
VQLWVHFVPEWKKQTLPQITLITLIYTDKKGQQSHCDLKAG